MYLAQKPLFFVTVICYGKTKNGKKTLSKKGERIMEVKITFRGCEHSDVIDTYIKERLKKVEELLALELSPISLEFLVTMHPNHAHHEVNARVHTPHFHCRASHEGKDVYAEINEVCDRLCHQLRDRRSKLIDRRKHGCDGQCRADIWREVEECDGDAFDNFKKMTKR